MPTIDGGHIFLTLLAPVRIGETLDAKGTVTTHSHNLREELANLPTAAQSPIAITTGISSPFSRCTRTHFLRLAVIDQPMWNGRVGGDALLAAVRRIDPLVHQPHDVLSRPWLLLSADIDRRPDAEDNGIGSWAEGLWSQSEAEMRAIFGHCHGFEQVGSAPAFADYVRRCQVETTMSFNDYWPGRPPLTGPSLKSLLGLLLAVAASTVLLLMLVVQPASLWWAALFALPGLLLGICAAAWRLWRLGGRPFPAAPDSDLPSVLKAQFVQQRFGFFAEAVQGLDAAALHDSFGHFLADVRPDDVESPTQAPGVIRSDGVMLVEHKPVSPKRVAL